MGITRKVPVLASSLDCRYHKLQFLSSEQRTAVYEILKKKCDDLCSTTTREATTSTSEDLVDHDECELPPSKRKKETALNFLLGEDELLDKDCPESEVDRFLDEKQLPSDTNVLDWWRVNSSKYPLLASLAKRYLSTPATSVPAERIFSAAGLTVNQQRASLSPENVDIANWSIPSVNIVGRATGGVRRRRLWPQSPCDGVQMGKLTLTWLQAPAETGMLQ
uniref:HAT C-terminal dimerisation domain-containing protein n=1 Tax=Amphimedon queenslandica TaxID=400682 RepID=A0A1X7T819_AMPQE